MRIGNESVVLTASEMALVPGGEPHEIENTSNEMLLDVSPPPLRFRGQRGLRHSLLVALR